MIEKGGGKISLPGLKQQADQRRRKETEEPSAVTFTTNHNDITIA